MGLFLSNEKQNKLALENEGIKMQPLMACYTET